jgi:transposase-like protein
MSKDQKNNYPLEFKISSAQLAVESGKSVAQTARDLRARRKSNFPKNSASENLLWKF